jgi:serine/threonine protein kinase
VLPGAVDTDRGADGGTASGPSGSSSGISHEVSPGLFDSTDPDSLLQKSFDDFEILELLGKGGMGVVYKARQKSLDRIVALKMLMADSFVNPILKTRFLEEARLAAGLSHPNIVSIYQIGQCQAGHYFVMEYLEGEALDAIIQRGPVPIKWAVNVLGRAADAVHYAHGRGVIHRDLKPANIMIHALRGPIVMDFGVAKHVGKPGGGSTQFGTVIGTPAFMPPEQAGDDPAAIGPQSDVYSLGAVLYATLTGRPPYGEGQAMATILKVVSAAMPPPVRSLRPEVPAELDAICMKCLAKKPADRYPTAKALADELRKLRTAGQPPTLRVDGPALTLVDAASGKELTFRKPLTLIGRTRDCHLILRAVDVSKKHCHILLERDQAIIEDLGSSNGTFVNGVRVDRAHLDDGDQIAIGEHHFRVRLPKG